MRSENTSVDDRNDECFYHDFENGGASGIVQGTVSDPNRQDCKFMMTSIDVRMVLGIAPYAALNFACYDLFKTQFYGGADVKQNVTSNLLIGAVSGTIAATVCYPLDTIRRRMQMPGKMYRHQIDAFATIWRSEGLLPCFL